MWNVDVVKKDGEVWLQNGWRDFAQYYSLEYGSLLVFRFNGNSSFWVLIFDKTASEIDYPLHIIPGEESDLEEIDCQNDLPNQNLDQGSMHASYHKRRKINPSSETQSGAEMLPTDSHFATIYTKSNVLNLEKSMKRSDRSRQDLGVSTQENGGYASGHRQLQPKVPAKMKALSSRDKRRAFLRDKAFQPKNDSFPIILQPYYIKGYRLNVPRKFAKSFLPQKNGHVTLSIPDVTLPVSDERKWPVKYVWNVYDKGSFVTFVCGWSAFVKDNRLKVDKGSKGDRVRKRMMEHKVELSEISTDSLDDFSPMQRREGKVRDDQLMPEEEDISIRRRPSSAATAETLEPAGRSYPSFKVVMSPSYLRGRTVNVPCGFVKELPQKRAFKVTLKVAKKQWPVNLHTFEDRKTSRLTGGFSAFLKENDIGLGDECVFELIDKDGFIVNVTISKCVG